LIRPLLKAPHAEFLGEIGEAQKGRFLGDAAALLFPIDWPEPFGLAMIEAMANGTPVGAMRRGSVPEVIDEGITGFVVDDVAGALNALPHARRGSTVDECDNTSSDGSAAIGWRAATWRFTRA
jgi:glycosyltransferase involved in cell wall biosynthesis